MPNSSPPMRHLPTLTEVVPPAAVAAASAATSAAAGPVDPPPTVCVETLMQQLAPVLEAELRKTAEAVLAAHVAAALPQALEAVRHTLEKTLAQGWPGR